MYAAAVSRALLAVAIAAPAALALSDAFASAAERCNTDDAASFLQHQLEATRQASVVSEQRAALHTAANSELALAQFRMQAWLQKAQANTPHLQDSRAHRAGHLRSEKLRYIFFERDHAGFNNIKLQLQSMVAIAAITGRTLVLPSPGHSDHVAAPYYEFDFFDAAALTGVVDVALSGAPGATTITVTSPLSQVSFRDLDQDRDWLFPMASSRIQHFECLNLNKNDRAVAAHAVLHGVVFDRHLEEMASSGLRQLGLASGDAAEDMRRAESFDCVHVRRGDFENFARQYQFTDREISAKLEGMLVGRPVLVVSDGRPELSLGSRVALASGAYAADVSPQTRVAVDMIMCSRAEDFVGSPLSTFTNTILELRTRRAVLAGSSAIHPKLYAGEPESQTEPGSLCWNKQTTFAGIEHCERGAAACFSDSAQQL